MANQIKQQFLQELNMRFGMLRKLDGTLSIYEIGENGVRIYIRYSKLHSGYKTFYGLRHEDLRAIEGRNSFICFLWDGQTDPLLVPFAEFEDVFEAVSPASDGQYKAQIYLNADGTDLYIARSGRFGVEGYFGWDGLETSTTLSGKEAVPEISHSQAQTLLGAIGVAKGHDIWIPANDRIKLDWSLANHFECRSELPDGFEEAANVLREIDVIWIRRGSNELRALFEIEHSTPIYSGLLRLNPSVSIIGETA